MPRLDNPHKPDFHAVERHLAQGVSLTNAWLEYSAEARKAEQNAFSYSRFSYLRHKWITDGRPLGATEVTRAADQTGSAIGKGACEPPHVAQSLMILDEAGSALQVRRGNLCIRLRDGSEHVFDQSILLPSRINKTKRRIEHILIAARGSSVTSDAVQWCVTKGIGLTLADRPGTALAFLSPLSLIDNRAQMLNLRAAQFFSLYSRERTLVLAKAIVDGKIKTLGLSPLIVRGLRHNLKIAPSLAAIIKVEATAAGHYWVRYHNAPIRFSGSTHVPQNWKHFRSRAPKLVDRFETKDARDPVNACLNYAYAVALGSITRRLVAIGLDPCFGFLHAAKPSRLSLAYDAIEMVRADIDRVIFKWISQRTFRPDEFEMTATISRKGRDRSHVVRLGKQVAREVASIAQSIDVTASTVFIETLLKKIRPGFP